MAERKRILFTGGSGKAGRHVVHTCWTRATAWSTST